MCIINQPLHSSPPVTTYSRVILAAGSLSTFEILCTAAAGVGSRAQGFDTHLFRCTKDPFIALHMYSIDRLIVHITTELRLYQSIGMYASVYVEL